MVGKAKWPLGLSLPKKLVNQQQNNIPRGISATSNGVKDVWVMILIISLLNILSG